MGSGVGLFGDLPHHKYTKYKAVIGTINAGITNFNKDIGSPHAHNLQRTGQRKYIFSRYREDIQWNMMHFADKYRIKIATRLFQYCSACSKSKSKEQNFGFGPKHNTKVT